MFVSNTRQDYISKKMLNLLHSGGLQRYTFTNYCSQLVNMLFAIQSKSRYLEFSYTTSRFNKDTSNTKEEEVNSVFFEKESIMSAGIVNVMNHQKTIAEGKGKVHPGQPMRFAESASVNDTIPQGDLYLRIADEVPSNFTKVKSTVENAKLVPGTTKGSKHILDSLDGVEVYHPPGFNLKDYEGLQGPMLVLTKERTVTHDEHGNVTIPAGFTVDCFYARVYDEELKRERRNAD